MSMNYDKEIAIKNLEARLLAQKGSLLNCEAEILKFQQEIEKYDATMVSLNKEIKLTEDMIKNQKGGDTNG